MNNKELKARVEEEEKFLQFYVRYEEEIIKMTSKREWEIEIDECLDILIDLYRLLKK
jgi:vacuolar-type H+-ATPase subunit B/Vma2